VVVVMVIIVVVVVMVIIVVVVVIVGRRFRVQGLEFNQTTIAIVALICNR